MSQHMGRCPVVGESVLYIPGVTDLELKDAGPQSGVIVETFPIVTEPRAEFFHMVRIRLDGSGDDRRVPYRPSSKSPTPGCKGPAFCLPNGFGQ